MAARAALFLAFSSASLLAFLSPSRRSIHPRLCMVLVLSELREMRGPSIALRNEPLVFVDQEGKPLHPVAVSKRFAKLIRRTDLPRIRLHDLRHTHATLALEAGVHPKVVSERLGHSTVSLTLDVYSHALEHMQHDAADRVSALVFGHEL